MPGTDVIVVGGGVIGLACARALAARGAPVLVLEPGPLPGAATPASAGMLAPQAESGHEVEDDDVLALSVLARDKALGTARELGEATGVDVRVLESGILLLAFTDTEAHARRATVARHRQLGLRADWLDEAEVQDEWPGIAPVVGAAYAPEDAALDPVALTAALRADGERLGVRYEPHRVVGLEVRGPRAPAVRTAHGRHDAPAIVLAAGAWSAEPGWLPHPLPVKPVRGQMIAQPWPEQTPPVILFGAGGYLVPREREALVGSTMESVGFDPATTPEGEGRLAAVARRLIPALAAAPVSRRWAGLRPLTPDGRPIVGRDPELEGLWYATGHGRNGILFAALTGEVLADLVLTGQSSVDFQAFAPARFSHPQA